MAMEDAVEKTHLALLRRLVKALSFNERMPMIVPVDGRSKVKLAESLHPFWNATPDMAGSTHVLRAPIPDLSQIHLVAEMYPPEAITFPTRTKVSSGAVVSSINLGDMSAGQCVEYLTNHKNYSTINMGYNAFICKREDIDTVIMKPMKRVVEEPMNVAAFLNRAGVQVSKSRVRSIGSHPTDCFNPAKIKAKAEAVAKSIAAQESELDELQMLYRFAKKTPEAMAKYQRLCVKEKYSSVVGKSLSTDIVIGHIELS